MKSVPWIIGLTLAFVVLLTFVPALLPAGMGSALSPSPMLFGFGVFVVKTAWTIGLVYVGARLALLHDRDASRT